MEYFGFCKGIKHLNLPNVSEIELYEGFFADFYTAADKKLYDLDWYLELGEQYGKKTLELACGNGRIMIPMIEKGFDMTGVDLSEYMLELLRAKCGERGVDPRVFCDDMCKYVTDESYDMVMLINCSICLLDTHEKVERLFDNVCSYLRPGGVFMLNYFEIPEEGFEDGERQPKYFFNNSKKSFLIFFEKVSSDRTKAVINWYGENIDKNGSTHRYLTSCTKHVFPKSVIANVIESRGLNIVREFACKYAPEGPLVRHMVLQKQL